MSRCCCDRVQPHGIESSRAATALRPAIGPSPRIMTRMDALGLPFEDLRKRSLAALLSAGLCIAAGTSQSEPRFGATTLSAVEDVRPQFALPALDGGMRDLAQQRGRVILVHF